MRAGKDHTGDKEEQYKEGKYMKQVVRKQEWALGEDEADNKRSDDGLWSSNPGHD